MPSPLRKRSKREGHHLMTKGISDILSIVYFNFGLEIWEMAFVCSETFFTISGEAKLSLASCPSIFPFLGLRVIFVLLTLCSSAFDRYGQVSANK